MQNYSLAEIPIIYVINIMGNCINIKMKNTFSNFANFVQQPQSSLKYLPFTTGVYLIIELIKIN